MWDLKGASCSDNFAKLLAQTSRCWQIKDHESLSLSSSNDERRFFEQPSSQQLNFISFHRICDNKAKSSSDLFALLYHKTKHSRLGSPSFLLFPSSLVFIQFIYFRSKFSHARIGQTKGFFSFSPRLISIQFIFYVLFGETFFFTSYHTIIIVIP